MRTLGIFTIALGLVMAVIAMPALGSENDPWDDAVTVGVCEVQLHPSGRTVSYTDSLGRSGGPIHVPDTVTLAFDNGGWIDVTIIHKPGADDGESVTKRFEIEPCPTTTTTSLATTTTTPSTTTTEQTSTTTNEPLTPTSTVTTAPPTTTTVPGTTTSSSTSTTEGTTTTSSLITTTQGLPNMTTMVPPSTLTTTIHTDTTIVESDDCSDEDGQAGLCLPNTGADSDVVFAVGVGLIVLGWATLLATRKETT